jgi:hypothetical protein
MQMPCPCCGDEMQRADSPMAIWICVGKCRRARLRVSVSIMPDERL